VLDRIVGNGPCSVLNRVLREKHGYGYHPGSELVTHRAAAQLELAVDIAVEVTGAALAVLEEELAALVSAPVADEWLAIGRRGALAGLARRMDGQAFLADLLQELAAAGLSPSYLTEHVQALHAVTAEDVRALAAELLDVDRMVSVLVSDRSALGGQHSSRLLESVL
jgi:predicted Zn-dependent peptidase